MTNHENKPFKTSENTLWLLINEQAQSLEKGILEAIMNSIDAKSKTIEISISPEEIKIKDKGKGFKNNEEISQFFSKIGTPHKKGDAKFGRFRMGRCQMFKYGKNIWRSNTFQMIVDVQKWGKEHEITSELPQQDGCEITIELYNPMTPDETRALQRTLSQWVAWSETPIKINGKTVSRNPGDFPEFWTKSTPEAWILTDETDLLSVFNMGIFVSDFPASEFGTGGTVTTKENIELIYARNDIKANCPVWKKIKKELTTDAGNLIDPNRLGPEDIKWIANQIIEGTLDTKKFNIYNLRIIQTGTKTKISPAELIFKYSRCEQVAIIDQLDEKTAIIQKQQDTLLIAEETLDLFGATEIHDMVVTVAQGIRNSRIYSGDTRFFTGANEPIEPKKVVNAEEIKKEITTIDIKILKKREMPETLKKLQNMLVNSISRTVEQYISRVPVSVEFSKEVSAERPNILSSTTGITVCFHPLYFKNPNPSIETLNGMFLDVASALCNNEISLSILTENNYNNSKDHNASENTTKAEIMTYIPSKATERCLIWIGSNIKPQEESIFNGKKIIETISLKQKK